MPVPLLLLHGFTGSPASWDEVVARLPGRAAIRPSLFGHGGPESAAASFEAELERLARFFPNEPVHLAGYSLGARLALGLALRHPSAIHHLTLISVHPGLSSDTERAERRRADGALAERLERDGLERFVEFWENQPLFASQARVSAERRARRRVERLAHDACGLAQSLRATGLGEMPDFGSELGDFPHPFTLLAGALDLKFVALAETMRARSTRAELIVLPDAGHDLVLECPERVAELLARH